MRTTKLSRTVLFLLFVFVLVLFSTFVFLNKKYESTGIGKAGATFPADIRICNQVPTNLRFSCYRSTIEKYYAGNIPAFTLELKNEPNLSFEATYAADGKVSYAIFGTNCHTFYHAAGDFISTYSNEDTKTILDYGPATCTNGYIMGVYKRVALKNNFSDDIIKEFYSICKKGAENQCAHEIGHILHDKYSYSILKTLDGISAEKYNLAYPQKYDYITFQDSTYKTDLNRPFEECEKLMPDKNKLAQCFTGIGHNLFLYSEFSADGYKSMFNECSKINEKNKNDCYAFLIYRIGINQAATHFLSHEFEEGRKVCNEIVALSGVEEMKEHCYRGIGGGIGLFADSEYALTEINDKNIDTIKNQFIEYIKLCENSNEKFVNSCFAGLFGTKFAKFYDLLRIFYEPIEKIRPEWDTDFEVVG